MEESTFDAIYIGVYVFVFIIAVSSAVFLYQSISEYAEQAYEYSHMIDSGSLILNTETSRNRILTGDEVLNYYYNYVKQDNYGEQKVETNYTVLINLNSKTETENLLTNTNLRYKEVAEQIGLNNQYLLEYREETADGKKVIYISKISDTYYDENGETIDNQVW